MRFEHLGIAVADADAAIALFEQVLGRRPYKVETVEREGVRTHFLAGSVDGRATKIELLEALSPVSPVGQFLAKRGPGLHHVAFEVENIDAEIARLRAAGLVPLADAPKPGADGKRIVFFHPKSTGGVLVELCETVVDVQRIDVPYEGGTLAAFVSGPADAPPLVVLHAALGATMLETARLARRWATRFRVHALDFMAHGASDPFDDTPLTFETFAGNVTALLDHLDLRDVRLFGFSLGGGVALLAARLDPARITRVAVHGVNVQWDADDVRRMVGAMRAARDGGPDARWAQRLAETHGADRWRALVDRMIAFSRALPAAPFPDAELAQIRQPTLVSTGDRDAYFELRHAVHLRQTLPDARLAVLPGLDHPIQGADPDAFAALIGDHLLGND